MAKKVIVPDDTQGDQSGPEALNNLLAIVEPITEKPNFIDLIKFDKKEESIKIIKDKSAEYAKITIDGVEDTTNYKIVVANMGQMRDDRRTFENAAYDKVIDPLKKALKEYADDVEAVVVEFKAAEKAERDKKDFIDDEKERIKKEKALAKQKAIEKRINDLFVLGAILANNCYTFAYDDGLMINSLQIAEFDDEEFGEFLEEVKTAWTVEQDRIEAERLEGIRLQEEQDALAEANRLQAQQNEEKATQLNEKRTKLRIKEITLLGLDLSENGYYRKQFNKDTIFTLTVDFIETSSDEDWDEAINSIQNYVAPDPEPEQEPPHPYAGQNTEYFAGRQQFDGSSIAAELELDNEPGTITDIEFEEATLNHTMFFGGQVATYKDIPISEKFVVRIFPVAFEDMAVNGCTIHNEGELEPGLRWAVIKL